MHRPLLLLPLLLLTGCEFWVTPGPDPATDGKLSCGEDQPVDGLLSGDVLEIEADAPSGLVIRTRFTDPAAAAILRIDGDEERQNLGEWWDPASGTTMLTGVLEQGMTATLDLFAADGVTIGGSLVMDCPVAEICWNLGDDDGDGLADCADPQCARYPACVVDQEDLETVTPVCDVPLAVEPPTLGPLDDQRTLYTTFPLGDEQPVESWWGGAEVRASLPVDASQVTIEAGSDGLACVAEEPGVSVLCAEIATISAGTPVTLPATGDLWLEPLGAAWTDLTITPSCVVDGR